MEVELHCHNNKLLLLNDTLLYFREGGVSEWNEDKLIKTEIYFLHYGFRKSPWNALM